MYPKNAASPERIAVGPVVQISDGAVQSSGVSIAVVPQGGASGAGGGTTAYDNGIVLYTPTQAETNYTSFIVTAYKTGCIPVSQTIVTTANATPGRVSVGDIAGTTQTAGDLAALITTVDDFLDTEVAAIKAKTDALPADPADASDIAASFSTVNSTLSTIAGYIDTEVAAIKAKTDNLPTDPADESLIIAATDAIMTRIGVAGAGLTALGDTRIAYLDAAVSSRGTGVALDAAGVRTAIGIATANVDTQFAAIPAAVGTRQITESYRANGAAPTLDQAVCETLAHLGEDAIVGTTKTVYKFDGSTSAMTFTLTVDGSGNVTAISRTT